MSIDEIIFCRCYLATKEKKDKIIVYKNLGKARYFFRLDDQYYECNTLEKYALNSSEAAFNEAYITKIEILDETRLQPDFLNVLNKLKTQLLKHISEEENNFGKKENLSNMPEVFDYSYAIVVALNPVKIIKIDEGVSILFKEKYIDVDTKQKIKTSFDELEIGDIVGTGFKTKNLNALKQEEYNTLLPKVKRIININL